MGYWGFKPYVSVAKRQANAAREMAKLAKAGQTILPVKIDGRTIARTFWGKAWCDHLESYSDYDNRLPRGRTYVRNGSVVHLQIEPGRIEAKVSGSELYDVTISIQPAASKKWDCIKSRCAGQIGSLVELLQGRLSTGVMQIVTARDGGLFPEPREIKMDCSCPDWAGMCKHVAAVLYGVGARLDQQPDLLFLLRKVDHLELITQAGSTTAIDTSKGSGKKTIATDDLSAVFGIELETDATGDVDARASIALGPETAPPGKQVRSRKRAEPTPRKGKRGTKTGARLKDKAQIDQARPAASKRTCKPKPDKRTVRRRVAVR